MWIFLSAISLLAVVAVALAGGVKVTEARRHAPEAGAHVQAQAQHATACLLRERLDQDAPYSLTARAPHPDGRLGVLPST